MSEWIPLYINPRGLKVVVFGGGSVATRRARMFAESGAVVNVYSLDFSRELFELDEKGVLSITRMNLEDADIESLIDEATIVVVAVDSRSLAERIAAVAKAKGVLVNNAVEAVKGNTIIPYRGVASYGLHVASTSLGKTGVGARRALERLMDVLERDPYYKTIFNAMAKVKKYLKENVGDPKVRFKANLAADADREVHRLAERGLEEEAYKRALSAALKAVEDASDPG